MFDRRRRRSSENGICSMVRGVAAIVLLTLVTALTFLNISYGETRSQSNKQRPNSQQTLSIPQDVIHHESHLKDYAQKVRLLTAHARDDLERRLGFTVRPLTIHLDNNEAEMREHAQRDHGFTPPQWSAGLAYPSRGEVYLPVTHHTALLPLIKHELAHIALGPSSLPLWINEGVAVSLGEGLSWERVWTLNEAASLGNLHLFKDLTRSFPHSSQGAAIAYAQSAHFINDLRSRYGPEAFHQWLSAIRAGEGVDQASQKHFQAPFWRIERTWRKGLERGLFAWLSIFFKSETLWSLSLLLFIVLGTRKLRRRKRSVTRRERPLQVHVAKSHKNIRFNRIFTLDTRNTEPHDDSSQA